MSRKRTTEWLLRLPPWINASGLCEELPRVRRWAVRPAQRHPRVSHSGQIGRSTLGMNIFLLHQLERNIPKATTYFNTEMFTFLVARMAMPILDWSKYPEFDCRTFVTNTCIYSLAIACICDHALVMLCSCTLLFTYILAMHLTDCDK